MNQHSSYQDPLTRVKIRERQQDLDSYTGALMHTPKSKAKPITKGSFWYNSRAIRPLFSILSWQPSFIKDSHPGGIPRNFQDHPWNFWASRVSGRPPQDYTHNFWSPHTSGRPLQLSIPHPVFSDILALMGVSSVSWLAPPIIGLHPAGLQCLYLSSFKTEERAQGQQQTHQWFNGCGSLHVWSKVLEQHPTLCGGWRLDMVAVFAPELDF